MNLEQEIQAILGVQLSLEQEIQLILQPVDVNLERAMSDLMEAWNDLVNAHYGLDGRDID